MAKFDELISDIDKLYAVVYNGAKRSAERVVDDLQQAGPNWTGKFSNSWEITEGTKRAYGGGKEGDPVPLRLPSLSVNNRKITKQDTIVFSILNTSPHKDLAMDKIEGVFERPKDAPVPKTQLGRSKYDPETTGRRSNTKRGQTGGGAPGATSSRTADLDWYTTYLDSGKIQSIIRSELDVNVRRLA